MNPETIYAYGPLAVMAVLALVYADKLAPLFGAAKGALGWTIDKAKAAATQVAPAGASEARHACRNDNLIRLAQIADYGRAIGNAELVGMASRAAPHIIAVCPKDEGASS